MGNVVFSSEIVELEDSADAVYRWVLENGHGDGFPVVPPTPELVAEMMAYSGRRPDEIIGTLPPRNAPATVEKIAINAAMAGCVPAYLSVVISAVSAMSDPTFYFNLNVTNTSTQSACLFLVVNGPLRRQLNINCSYGCLGPGWRANATIGRAIRLIQLNIAGSIPGEVSKSTLGQPGRYTMCIGEHEENSPWEPLHVERGFRPEESTVTVFGAAGTSDVLDGGLPNQKPETILGLIALNVEGQGSDRVVYRHPIAFIILLSPPQAKQIARAGWSKADVKRYIYERTQNVPLSKWPEELQQYMIRRGIGLNGLVPIIPAPEAIDVVVAGGLGGMHSSVVPGRSGVTKLI